MTKQEKHALKKIIREGQHPFVRGRSYSENMRITDEGDDPSLLDEPLYRKGFQTCHEQYSQFLNFLLTATKKDLIKFAGRAK